MQMTKEIFSVESFLSPASFWFPEALVESAWLQHAPFAFWLMETSRPQLFVELGTHHGFSYLAFCQAAKRVGLGTKGYAVDTWRGDEHAGFYGDAVYARLRDLHDPHYGGFSRLVRSTFDEALPHFAEKSIDLLHIDGRHFYDDVKHDFESWKDKLSDRAIVLFHDTNVRERGFGVFKLWEELRQQYPVFEFFHGHGLGVLGVGTEQPEELSRLFEAEAHSGLSSRIREIYARLGSAIEERYLLASQGTALRQHEEELARIGRQGEMAEQRLLEQTAHISELERSAAEREYALATQRTRSVELERRAYERLREIGTLQAELVFLRAAKHDAEQGLAAERTAAGERDIERCAAGWRGESEARDTAERQFAEARTLLSDMQKRSTSSRWLLRAIAEKAIHAPRDISRRLRRSWHKRRGAFDRKLAAMNTSAFDFRQLRYAQYRKYASSRLVLRFEPALSASFANRMRNRMAKNAPGAKVPATSQRSSNSIEIRPGSRALFDQMFAAAKSLSDEYVPFEDHASDLASRVKAIAFYLPQFHPIAENDQWWGKGFTEWTNVSKATPQFVGHYQPRLPGELGFYDLRVPEIMKRQVELAKNYGIHGFCFHYYWFSGRKRLLERPLNQFLADRSLDFPFCVCWANENWTRRWDGSEAEILMEQRHEPQDDLEFIEDISPILKDRRYIRVNGRPLIIVYRVDILPDARKTADIWRKYCASRGIGEPWLVAAQSFGISDPRRYGFDAAVEFPPHNSGKLGRLTDLEFLNADFQGRVHSYESYVEQEIDFSWPEYNLYKTIVPSWDNEARRPGRGTIFAGSSPALYEKWLESIRQATDVNCAEYDQKLVFINAWNEWAEGAHLEPDRRFGYAYLDATRRVFGAIDNTCERSPKRSIAIVSHDAFPAGAQYQVLHLAQMLCEAFGYKVEIVVLGGGALIGEFAKVARVHDLSKQDPQGQQARDVAQDLFEAGVRSAIVNSTVSGLFASTLKQAGVRVVSRVVELPGIIGDYKLEAHAKAIASDSDAIVFPARTVREGFTKFAEIDGLHTTLLQPGLYKKPATRNPAEIALMRSDLRMRLSVDPKSQIAIGVGYADERKGIDLFVEVAIDTCLSRSDSVFVWVGGLDSGETALRARVAEAALSDRIIFAGHVAHEDVGLFYVGADIFLMTSREDPFPQVVLEALDAGLPVIAFEGATGCDDLLARGCGQRITPFATEEMAAAVKALLDRPEEARLLGERGREIVAREFSYHRYAFELAALADTDLRRVSVIVPSYNHCRYLERRLRSIREQMYPIFEIIVLDDASTDGSGEWLAEHLGEFLPHAQLIVNVKNSGSVWDQWRKGVEAAKGDYIWIAESDDYAKPTFLTEVIKGFDNPNVVLSYCQSQQIDGDGKLISEDYLGYVADISPSKWTRAYVADGLEEIRTALAIKNTIPNVSAVLFSRQALSKTLESIQPALAKLRASGDRRIYAEMLTLGRIAFSPTPLNEHRRHKKSVVHTAGSIQHLGEILEVQQWARNRFDIDPNVKTRQAAYAQEVYEYFRLKTDRFPNVEMHPDFEKFFS